MQAKFWDSYKFGSNLKGYRKTRGGLAATKISTEAIKREYQVHVSSLPDKALGTLVDITRLAERFSMRSQRRAW